MFMQVRYVSNIIWEYMHKILQLTWAGVTNISLISANFPYSETHSTCTFWCLAVVTVTNMSIDHIWNHFFQ